MKTNEGPGGESRIEMDGRRNSKRVDRIPFNTQPSQKQSGFMTHRTVTDLSRLISNKIEDMQVNMDFIRDFKFRLHPQLKICEEFVEISGHSELRQELSHESFEYPWFDFPRELSIGHGSRVTKITAMTSGDIIPRGIGFEPATRTRR
jgi:hypothetical protein